MTDQDETWLMLNSKIYVYEIDFIFLRNLNKHSAKPYLRPLKKKQI